MHSANSPGLPDIWHPPKAFENPGTIKSGSLAKPQCRSMKLEWWPRCQPWAMAKEGDLSVMSWNLLAPSKAEVGLLETVLIESGD